MVKPMMSSKKPVAIIICAGEATRWNNHMGVSKHFAEVDGEPILQRTVRLANKYTDRVFVVAKTPDYKLDGAKLFVPKLDPTNEDADKYLSSRDLWNLGGRTVVLLGDVFFTESAMRKIFSFKKREWQVFGRYDASQLTGTPWGELFAQSFYPEHIPEHLSNLNYIANLRREGAIDRCSGWEHYRAMAGIELTEHKITKRFYEINDWTDDFDFPEDYDRFIERWNKVGKAQ